MSRLSTILLGSLVLVLELGCGSSAPRSATFRTASDNISVVPSSAVTGSPDSTITIMGSQQFAFTNAAHKVDVAVWSANGSDTPLATTFVSGSRLSAIVPATLLVSPVEATLRVEIWDPRDADVPATVSSSVPFSVTTASAALPVITSISPPSVTAGSRNVPLTITGSDFANNGFRQTSVAFWTTDPNNLHDFGAMLDTNFVSSSQLTALIPAALLQNANSVQIVVVTGDIMGMSDGFFGYPKSNSVTFTVTP
jgi:hypothetical protein